MKLRFGAVSNGFDLDTVLLLIKPDGTQESLWPSQKICLLYKSIYNHEFLIFNPANSAIANINDGLNLGLTKTEYEMSFNYVGYSTQSLSQYEKSEMKLSF